MALAAVWLAKRKEGWEGGKEEGAEEEEGAEKEEGVEGMEGVEGGDI